MKKLTWARGGADLTCRLDGVNWALRHNGYEYLLYTDRGIPHTEQVTPGGRFFRPLGTSSTREALSRAEEMIFAEGDALGDLGMLQHLARGVDGGCITFDDFARCAYALLTDLHDRGEWNRGAVASLYYGQQILARIE